MELVSRPRFFGGYGSQIRSILLSTNNWKLLKVHNSHTLYKKLQHISFQLLWKTSKLKESPERIPIQPFKTWNFFLVPDPEPKSPNCRIQSYPEQQSCKNTHWQSQWGRSGSYVLGTRQSEVRTRIRIRIVRKFLLFCDFFMTFYLNPEPEPDPYQNVTDPQHSAETARPKAAWGAGATVLLTCVSQLPFLSCPPRLVRWSPRSTRRWTRSCRQTPA